eukprot:1305800-Rhodomonas_salina.3
MSGTMLAHDNAMSGTMLRDVRYDATRCPVLRKRMQVVNLLENKVVRVLGKPEVPLLSPYAPCLVLAYAYCSHLHTRPLRDARDCQ